MKVSIITVCYNSAETIRDTIKSVISQTHSDIEYIIVDGGSKDESINIIKEYEGEISKWISEKDKGIYDAINKGIALSSGEIVAILNSDDFYSSNDVIANVSEAFEKNNCDLLYGDLQYVDRYDTTRVTRQWKSGKYKHGYFLRGWMPPHPALFIKKDIYNKLGNYRIDFRVSADYEMMIRLFHVNKLKIFYLQEVLVKMRRGGVSGGGLSNKLKVAREDMKAWKSNGIDIHPITILMKTLSKVKQLSIKQLFRDLLERKK